MGSLYLIIFKTISVGSHPILGTTEIGSLLKVSFGSLLYMTFDTSKFTWYPWFQFLKGWSMHNIWKQIFGNNLLWIKLRVVCIDKQSMLSFPIFFTLSLYWLILPECLPRVEVLSKLFESQKVFRWGYQESRPFDSQGGKATWKHEKFRRIDSRIWSVSFCQMQLHW